MNLGLIKIPFGTNFQEKSHTNCLVFEQCKMKLHFRDIISFGGIKFKLLLKIIQNMHISKYKNGDRSYKNG